MSRFRISLSHRTITVKEVLLNLNRKSVFSPAEERFRLDQKELKECYIMAMALDIRSTINEDGPVASIIEKAGFK